MPSAFLFVFAKKLSHLGVLIFLCVAPVANSVEGQTRQPVSLYLPINTIDFPELDKRLTLALSDQGVSNITVKNTDYWHPYQQGLRLGRRGIYFAQPHFAAWVIHQHNFKPILKLHGQLKYVLAVRRNDTQFFEVNDLAGAKLCRTPGLNLGTVWLNQLLGEHQLTARSEEVSSVVAIIKNQSNDSHSNCDAFVLSAFSFNQINKVSKEKYVLFAQSPKYKHHAFVAHPSIDAATTQQLTKALKSKEVKRLMMPYLRSLSRWQNLLPVQLDDYGPDDANLLETYWGEITVNGKNQSTPVTPSLGAPEQP